jgi:SAM-dependent methyltransferase
MPQLTATALPTSTTSAAAFHAIPRRPWNSWRLGRGPILELGIGTGRISLPLAERGIEVHGIDAWPSELDLMARLAGLRLRARFGGWGREPFTAASQSPVSVYERLH